MSKCLYPIKVNVENKYNFDKLTKKQIIVRCGKCINCQNTKRKEEIKRAGDEAKYWKYGVMLTLTYNSEHIPILDITSRIEREPLLIKRRFYENIKDEIVETIRNWNDREEHTELEKMKYYAYVNEFTTLKYNDYRQYMKTARTNIKRDKKLNDKSFSFYGCGEYPDIRENRGRPHYHIILMFNDNAILKHFITAWTKGNIAFDRGDNQIDAKINYMDIKYKQSNKDKLNCMITQETKKDDIKRIFEYIRNGNIKLDMSQFNIYYVAGYTNKKRDAETIRNHFERTRTIKRFWTIADQQAEYEYKKVREQIRAENKELKELRAKGIATNRKEEPFRFYAKDLGKRYALDNRDKFINNPQYNTPQGEAILPSYYIKVIEEHEKKQKTGRQADIRLSRNLIASKLKLKAIQNYEQFNKIDYQVIKYPDNTIDIIDYDNNNLLLNKDMIEKYITRHKEDIKSAKERLFGAKQSKSDTFANKIDFRKVNKEIKDNIALIKDINDI